MTGRRQPKRLYGVQEFAELAGISRQRAYMVMRKPEFPTPYAVTATGEFWLLHDLVEFIRLWDRKPGRPKRT